MRRKYEFTTDSRDGHLIEGHIVEISNRSIDPHKLVPWVALLISLISLGFTIWQVNVSIEHDRTLIKPHLTLSRYSPLSPPFGIDVVNAGFGSAIIKFSKFSYKGKEISSLEMFKERFLTDFPEARNHLRYTDLSDGDHLRSDKRVTLLQGDDKITPDQRRQIFDVMTKCVQVEITYCSVYDDDCRLAKLNKTDILQKHESECRSTQ